MTDELKKEFDDVLYCSCFNLPEPCERHKNREDVVTHWAEVALQPPKAQDGEPMKTHACGTWVNLTPKKEITDDRLREVLEEVFDLLHDNLYSKQSEKKAVAILRKLINEVQFLKDGESK